MRLRSPCKNRLGKLGVAGVPPKAATRNLRPRIAAKGRFPQFGPRLSQRMNAGNCDLRLTANCGLLWGLSACHSNGRCSPLSSPRAINAVALRASSPSNRRHGRGARRDDVGDGPSRNSPVPYCLRRSAQRATARKWVSGGRRLDERGHVCQHDLLARHRFRDLSLHFSLPSSAAAIDVPAFR